MADAASDPEVRPPIPDDDFGGEAPCYLPDVCTECGLLISDRLAETCPRCGTPRDPERRAS